MTLLFLATVSASEEISDVWSWMAMISFILSSFLALSAVFGSFISKLSQKWVQSLAALAMLFGSITVAFVTYVYVIDFVPVDGDGTKASPSIWVPLSIPAIPVFASLLALGIKSRSCKNAFIKSCSVTHLESDK